jgi:predicted transcriptional regulator of viral defense system
VGEFTANASRSYGASLSRREVTLLAGWERERRRFVTSRDLRTVVGEAAASDVARTLVKKGALERLQRGVYLVRPFRSLLRKTAPSSPMAVAALLHGQPYYLGGLWAFTHHGLTEQQYVSVLDAFVTRPRPSRTVAGARVVFHVVRSSLMEYGVSQSTIEGVAVRVSDPERTLIDVLDYPRMVGGVGRAVDLFTAALPRANARTIVGYAVRGSRTSTCQRVGVMLERARVPSSVLHELARRVAGSRSEIALVPGLRTGRLNRRWNVVENDSALDATPSP